MIGLIIYFVGSGFAYWRMRKTWINEDFGDDWGRVVVCLLAALMSWAGVLVALALDHTAKAPKWL
jgi:hypothetical protein